MSMSKEKENLVQQRRESKRLRRLNARYNGTLHDKVRNPGYSTDSKGSSSEYKAWSAAW